MNTSQYKITWEDWNHSIGYEEETTDMEFEEEFDETMEQNIKFQPVMPTPMGFVSAPAFNSNNFKFWLAHTNFKITSKIVNLIDNIEGIETLEIFTPYRARISVGHGFQDREVMHQIDLAIDKLLNRNYPSGTQYANPPS